MGCKRKRLPLPKARSVVTSGAHTCAIWEDGKVYCWGKNDLGQLGQGTREPSLTPRAVPLRERVTQLALGRAHTCARGEAGDVWCWGQHGAPAIEGTPKDTHLSPVRVAMGPARQIAAAGDETCAILEGSVSCWGSGAPPHTVQGVTEASEIALGGARACALGAYGAITCWPLGVQPQVAAAVERIDGVRAVHVALGARHGCAIREDRHVVCWGDNTAGQLGIADPAATALVEVPAVEGAESIRAGDVNTCVVLTNGTVTCWGDNTQGQLCTGGTDKRMGPIPIPGLLTIAQVTVGGTSLCALMREGKVRCWGNNDVGQLGTGTREPTPVPMPVKWGTLREAPAAP